MRITKRLGGSQRMLTAAGHLLSAYLKLVRRTVRFVNEPPDYMDICADQFPVIWTTWHGQHLLPPMMLRPEHNMAILVSKSADGEVNAVAVRDIGHVPIRGSGGRSQRKTLKKGGVRGLIAMRQALRDGLSVAQTADVAQGEARRCGLGVVTLAKHSGRPIMPAAALTRWSIPLPTADKTRIPLPFCKGAFVIGEPIYVAASADEREMEEARLKVQQGVDAVTARAEALAR